MSFSAVLLIFANLSAAVWAVSRMVVSASREGLLPKLLTSTRNGAPLSAILMVLIVLFFSIFMASIGLLPLHSLLEYAGQNFLILYGLAAIALFYAKVGWKSRIASALAIVVVIGILMLRDFSAMVYPSTLVIIGVSISFITSRRITIT